MATPMSGADDDRAPAEKPVPIRDDRRRARLSEHPRAAPVEDNKRLAQIWSRVSWAAIAVGLAIAAFFALRAIARSDAESVAPPASAPSGSSAVAPPAAPRCAEVSPQGFIIGEPPAPKPPPAEDAGDQDPLDRDDELAPFAVEVGEGAAYDGGFAVGALREAEGGSVAFVALLGPDGKDGKLVRLARSRGDMDPPVVAGSGRSVLAAMFEPNAAGRAIKIARVTDGEVAWGPELSEGRDESLAVDMAVSGARALIAWDDVTKDHDRGAVMLSSLDPKELKATAARPVSKPDADADSPRLVARPGGFWLAYVSRAEGRATAKPGKPDAARPSDTRDKGDKGDKPKPPSPADDDEGEAQGGQAIERAWVEVVPLDESGTPTGTPQRVTPKDGHVLAFDIVVADEGAALVAWRDDDTPSGSSGGTVTMARVALGGSVGEAKVIADEGVGTGVPSLLPGWVAVSGVSGPKQLAAVAPIGVLLEPLTPEPSLGTGEPIAATRDAMLVARHLGRAVRLDVMRCAPPTPDAGP
jgi:hypothetical protein